MAFDLKPTPIVLRLIIINTAIYLLMAVFSSQSWVYQTIEQLALSPEGVADFKVWQPFTYMWLHEVPGLNHILFNMMGLWFLGTALERRWGKRTFLKFYLLSGLGAGVFTLLVGWLVGGGFAAPVIGASGAILALVAAFSMVMPNAQLHLFFVLPVRAKHVIWIALGFDVVLFLIEGSANRVAIQTHFGGAIAAWLLITGNWRPRVAMARFQKRFGGKNARTTSKKPSGWRVIDGGKNGNGRDDDDLLH
ncbi:MAG: membrane associated rhomboid family serine protease [Myxococcota bacterium]|jgi:membrane associated rhomboid family serine protease